MPNRLELPFTADTLAQLTDQLFDEADDVRVAAPVMADTIRPLEQGATPREQASDSAMAIALQAACAREEALLQRLLDQTRRQTLCAQEFDHRLNNGLQLISSMLSLQSRTATPEASAQLITASRRVVAFGHVHHRLHHLDDQDNVEFKGYLLDLCTDLSGLLFEQEIGRTIVVESDALRIPTVRAIPLGFIVNELVTNSAKYGEGPVTVRLAMLSPDNFSLSVLDQGKGLPAGFRPLANKGFGMKIVQGLVRQIGGALQLRPERDGQRSFLMVTFAGAAT